MVTPKKALSFQERLRRGCRQLEAKGWDVRTCSAQDVIAYARGLIRGKTAKNTTGLKKQFDAIVEKKSTPVQVSIAKRNYREDGTGCEILPGKGRPSWKSLGYGDEDAASLAII